MVSQGGRAGGAGDQGTRSALAASGVDEESWLGGEGEWDKCSFPTSAEVSSLGIFAQEETGNKKSREGQTNVKCGAGHYQVN